MTTPNTQALDALDQLIYRLCGQLADSSAAFDWKIVRDYANELVDIKAALTPSRADTAGEDGLWCLHIIGPDDIHPAPSKAHAEAAAILSNAATKRFFATKPDDGMWPHIEAVAIPYPYSAESHAAEVSKFIPEWLIPKGYTPAGDAQGAVDGFVLVPREPTPQMIEAYHAADRTRAPALSSWRAMLAAAPTPATPDVEENHVERLLALRNEGGELFIMPEDVEALDVAIHALSAPACPVAAGASDFLFALRRAEATKQTAPAVDWVHAEEDAYVIQRLGRLLAEISITLNGPYLANSVWSYHDLPAKVEALASESRTVADEMDAWSEKRLSGPHDNRHVRRLLGGWAERLRAPTPTPEAPSGSQAGEVPDDTLVICPNCVHQFRAIPVQVQRLLVASGHAPPFTTPTPADSGVRDALIAAADQYDRQGENSTADCLRCAAKIMAAKPESA